MLRKVVVATWLLATVACVDSSTSDDEARDSVRMETEEVSIQAEWSSIEFEWAVPYLLPGQTRYVDVIVTDSLGREVHAPPGVEFDTADPTKLKVDQSGAVTGVKPGETFVIARLDGLQTELTVSVESDVPSALRTSLEAIELTWLDDVNIGANAFNANDRMLDTVVQWQSRDPNIARVDDRGTVTGVANGETEIVATAGDVTATVPVRVVSPPVESVEITDAPIYMAVGEVDAVSAVALASNLRAVDDATLTFHSLSPRTVCVDPDTGLLLAHAEGPVTIVITSQDARREHEIFVQPAVGD